MCRDHYVAISRAYEGLKGENLYFLCAHVARLEPVSMEKDRNGPLVAAAAMLLGIVAFEGARWLARRDVASQSIDDARIYCAVR